MKEATPYSVRLSLTLDGATISVAMLTSGTYAIGAVNVKQVDIKVLISTTTPILTAAEGGLMSADQNQPLPHTYHALVGTQLWRGGIRTQPTTLQVSKPAQADELVPEGSNRKATETVKLSDTQPGSARISAMWAEGTRLHIHTNSGIIVLASPNTDPTQLAEPPVLAGALNGNCLVQWEKNVLYYLGSDLRIYRQADDNLFTKLQASAVDDASQQYIRDRVDLTELGRRPERAFMFADTAAKMLWFFLPAKDGTLKGFAHDLMLDGLTGEFDYPKVYDLARMESNRPELLFGDEAGNLFVWNTEAQSDIGNAFPSTSTLTPYSTSAPVPDEWAGYGHVDYDHNGDGTPSRFYGAAETILQTGYFDLSTPERRKAFQALIFRTVRNSRGFVEVKLTGLGGDEVTFVYGDMGEVPRADHRADLMLCDSAISVQLRIISAQDKPWIIRDLSILWQSQGTI